MIAHRQMLPVGHERIRGIAEHLPDVAGVFPARVEVDKVADFNGEEHPDGLPVDKQTGVQDQLRHAIPHGLPVRLAQSDKSIEWRSRKNGQIGKTNVAEVAERSRFSQIHYSLAKSYAETRAT